MPVQLVHWSVQVPVQPVHWLVHWFVQELLHASLQPEQPVQP
ncbi:MAG: hypothetical protein RSC06_09320 [Clostridia bacterium]